MSDDLTNRNKNLNRGYRKLEVWQESIDLYVFVKNKVRELKNVPYKVRAQVEVSAFSCPSNIAEGYCRRGIKESIQFNTIALASLGENYTQILALHEGNDIDSPRVIVLQFNPGYCLISSYYFLNSCLLLLHGVKNGLTNMILFIIDLKIN
ncbi:MAG: four helix bundle protein [Bacteroidetes bacterium]|nr:four helix bundle protein [Bacteroidota bacterium]MBU2506729.1 four helix bundle protein [Bacteroidota bacterium]